METPKKSQRKRIACRFYSNGQSDIDDNHHGQTIMVRPLEKTDICNACGQVAIPDKIVVSFENNREGSEQAHGRVASPSWHPEAGVLPPGGACVSHFFQRLTSSS